MHKIYEDEGDFNLDYQLPQILYSSLISSLFNNIFKILGLYETNIIELKKIKIKKNLNERVAKLKNKFNFKFVIYIIISFCSVLLFGYYLSMFCTIYRNTQIHLIKNTLISFGLNLIYPFFIYLLPGMFRIPALSNSKNKRKYLYTISKILQFF